MALIKECFEEYQNDFTETLIKANFSPDEATMFLPAAFSGILKSSNKVGIPQTMQILLADRPHQLLKKLDVPMIARYAEISFFQVTTGLQAIAPILLQAYSDKSPELVRAAFN